MNYSENSTLTGALYKVKNVLSTENKSDLIWEVYKGLTAKQKYISSRFFYNHKGSALFEEITTLPEYYPTRTEKQILKANAQNIIGNFENLNIIELGSGDCSKISILLDSIPENKMGNVCYMPVDVSETAIFNSAGILTAKYPGLRIHGLLADFLKHLTHLPGKGNRLICFFGSTLGNLGRRQAIDFLSNLKKLLAPGDRLMLGLDMIKDKQILHAAYNDKKGVTALFNKNILNVINDSLKTDFNTTDFDHVAWYNNDKTRIEMHLKAKKDIVITSTLFPEKIHIKTGETIHTENSHKYSLYDIQSFALRSGLTIENIFSDNFQWFSVVKFKCDD